MEAITMKGPPLILMILGAANIAAGPTNEWANLFYTACVAAGVIWWDIGGDTDDDR